MMIKNSLFLPARSVVEKCHNKTSDICFKLQENIDFLQYFIKMNNIIGTSHFANSAKVGDAKPWVLVRRGKGRDRQVAADITVRGESLFLHGVGFFVFIQDYIMR
ncbi:MAG: hypothetical protein Kow00111_25460 [Thermincola ferriacetica]